MTLQPNERSAIIAYRLEKATDTMKEGYIERIKGVIGG